MTAFDEGGINTIRARDRIGVAHWRDYFPAAHEISPAFADLTAASCRPVERGWHWENRAFLDPTSYPFAPANPEAMRAVIANSTALGQSPFWLRHEAEASRITPADFSTALVAGAGLTEIPAPTPARPDQVSNRPRPLGQGQGAAGDTRPPRRVLGLQGEDRRS